MPYQVLQGGSQYVEKGLLTWRCRFLLDAMNGYTLEGATPCRVTRGVVSTIAGQGITYTRVIRMRQLRQWCSDNMKTQYGLWALAAVGVCGVLLYLTRAMHRGLWLCHNYAL